MNIIKLIKTAVGIGNSFNERLSVNELFDPVQSHSITGIESLQELNEIKGKLKPHGCNKFRTVKTKFNTLILCFKVNEKKLA